MLINTYARDDPTPNVRIVECVTQQIGGLRTGIARITVLNYSSRPKNYRVTIAFDNASGTTRYDAAAKVVDGVQPGQLAAVEVDRSSAVGTDTTCRVISVIWT